MARGGLQHADCGRSVSFIMRIRGVQRDDICLQLSGGDVRDVVSGVGVSEQLQRKRSVFGGAGGIDAEPEMQLHFGISRSHVRRQSLRRDGLLEWRKLLDCSECCKLFLPGRVWRTVVPSGVELACFDHSARRCSDWSDCGGRDWRSCCSSCARDCNCCVPKVEDQVFYVEAEQCFQTARDGQLESSMI